MVNPHNYHELTTFKSVIFRLTEALHVFRLTEALFRHFVISPFRVLKTPPYSIHLEG